MEQFILSIGNWKIQDLRNRKIYDLKNQQDRVELNQLLNTLMRENYVSRYNDERLVKYAEKVDALNETIDLLYEEIDTLNETNKDLKQLNDDLYTYRLLYNALLYNEWHKHNEVEVYKSRRHHDGSIPFENDERDWFIVVALLPDGRQISNHYPLESWDYFKIPVYPKVKDEFDGHTIDDVFERLKELSK